MAKRILAGILGTTAAIGGLLPLGYAVEIFKDFGNPDVAFWPNVLGVLIASAIGLAALAVGIDFLRFASSGRREHSSSWARPVLLGIGLFFPAFVFSLPLSIVSVSRVWPSDDLDPLPFEVSACIGVATAIISTVLLLRKRALRHGS